jgi:hypothetical protein
MMCDDHVTLRLTSYADQYNQCILSTVLQATALLGTTLLSQREMHTAL